MEKGKSFDDDADNLAWELGRTELHDDPSTSMHEQKDKESMEQLQPSEVSNEGNNSLPKDWRFMNAHPQEQVIGDVYDRVRTRSSYHQVCGNLAFISHIEPTCIEQALNGESWILAMQEKVRSIQKK